MARKLAAIAFSLSCLNAGSVLALGLGEVRLESFLNEPLKASVDLLNLGGLSGDEIKVRLAASEDFDKLGLERNYFLTSIVFDVVADGSGGARILISSEEPVLEPYLDFIVEARWPSGRLIREYTILVDPQVFSQATPVVSASERVAEVEGIPAPAKKNVEVTATADDDTMGSWGVQGGASSGTRVDMRDSDLSPGAMPQRDYSAATAGTPTPGSRYMISRDQTLWDIANRAKPAGASVHQTMLDIQRLNPDAFINGNINRIKAGFIIYLPGADDISSEDLNTALSEVSQQNQAWRSGHDGDTAAVSRPKLTISAEPEDDVAAEPAKQAAAPSVVPVAAEQPSGTGVDAGVAGKPSLQGGNTEERLAALEQQLQSLQRIVTLKDDQIAALQTALADAGGAAEVDPKVDPAAGTVAVEPPAVVAEAPVEATVPTPSVADTQITDSAAVTEPAAAVPVPKAKKAISTKPEATASEAAPNKSWTSYLLYLLGALVLAVGGFLLAKRRSVEDEDVAPARQTPPKEDVFSAVRLQEQALVLEPAKEETQEYRSAPSARDNRGYGERRHDEYASDNDSADALAEADIYIAYGRHQQAIDLLNNALANEPGNPVYRLKLIEIHTERKNHVAATAQMEKLQSIGDPEAIARATSLMATLEATEDLAPPKSIDRKPSGDGPGLAPNPLAMMNDANGSLEADFSGLEIEAAGASGDDDLDLSKDFGGANAGRYEDEELVIAADSNGLSTKLDLARAYLDMGDDEGARQILVEVVAEGSEDLKAEARVLLDRIDG